jgi:hypothetical protein
LRCQQCARRGSNRGLLLRDWCVPPAGELL